MIAPKASSIPKKPEDVLAPLSLAQQRLWFLYQFNPHSPEYNISRAWRIKGSLDTEALGTSLNLILARHEALRTTFQEIDGQSIQVIQPILKAPFKQWDWSAYPPAQLEAKIDRFLIDEPCQPFDLLTGPLLRFTLIRCEPDDHVFVFTIHHMVFDGTSLKVFCQELSQVYQATLHGQPVPFSPLPIQYQDYAYWQQAQVTEEKLTSQLVFWKQHLQGASLVLELPSDGARPKDNSGPGSYLTFTLPPHVISILKQLIQPQGITMFMALLAVFQILLSRYTGQRDILVGTPIAGRTHTDLEELIGFLVNILVLRTHIIGHPTFLDVLGQVRKTCFAAYRHQDLPFEKLVEVLKPVRDLSRSPIVQAIFQVRQASDLRLIFPQVEIHPFPVKKRTGNFDLHMICEESESGIQGFLYYPQGLYAAPMMARFVKHYEILLEALVANPHKPVDHISFLTEAETHQQLIEWNNTATDYPRETCLHDLVQQQALRTPDAIVLVYQEQQMTYREVTRRASQLAHYLVSLGVGPEVRVGLCHERSPELIIGLLGILQAGGAYVPLDPTYPLERLRFVTHDAQIQFVVTQEHLKSLFPHKTLVKVSLDRDWPLIATYSAMPPTRPVSSTSLAYVIYTSGSTGRPKGVQIEHRNVVNFLIDVEAKLQNAEPDIMLTTTSLSFDISIFEVFAPLAFGGRLILASQAQVMDGYQLVETLFLESVTKMLATPAGWRLLLEANWKGKPDLVILTGGEALSENLAHQLLKRGAALWNLYGPTETTIFSTCTRIVPSDKLPITIGSPIVNTQTYIVNTEYLPVPIGVPGELYIGGDGVSRGYLNRPDLTAERFLPDPFSQHRGGRLYRTGDRAKYRDNGKIEWLGRLDHQVKLRGFRLELGEIEVALRDHPAVTETVVVCREDMPGEKQLVAYVVSQAPVSELRPYLQDRLLDYMVPSVFVVLEQFPVTPNGKLDRKALPAPAAADRTQGQTYVAPQTILEELLAEVWKEVLKLERIGIHDNFFDRGGHSLLAIQVISRVQSLTHNAVSVSILFDCPTIAQLANSLESTQPQEDGDQSHRLSPQNLDGPIPLSFAQQRLWFLDQWEPNSALYNIPAVFRLHGTLKVEALEQAITDLVARHETFRTTFSAETDNPKQYIHPMGEFSSKKLIVTDIGEDAGEKPTACIERIIAEETSHPFDLAKGPLFRARLVIVESREAVLILTLHHIIADGWSMGVLWKELGTLYNARATGTPMDLPPLPIQYADFAVWQREWLQGKVLAQQVTYWQQQLQGAPGTLTLPTDYPRPPVQSFRGARQSMVVSADLTRQLKTLGLQNGVTLFMTGLAAFQVLLARYTGETDIVVGSPIANRTRQEIEGLIGFFVNTLVLRTRLTNTVSFRQLLHQVQATCLEAYRHQDLPFEKLVEILQPQRDASRNPLFQVMFQLEQEASQTLCFTGLTSERMNVTSAIAKFDLSLTLVVQDDGLHGMIEYSTDLFADQTITRLIGHFHTLLEGLVADPDQSVFSVPLLTTAEHKQLVEEWNQTASAFPADHGIHELFEAQVARTPDTVAVIYEEEQLTYTQLNQRANQLAHYLQQQGVGPEVLVGVCLERDLDLIVSLLAILKAGGVYVPLDPSYPLERLTYMLTDANIMVVLTSEAIHEQLGAYSDQVLTLQWTTLLHESSENLPSWTVPANLVYVLYTSGSTGRPKGVMIAQASAVAFLHWAGSVFSSADLAGVLAATSICFDLSVFELFVPLSWGGTVVLAENALQLPELLEIDRVTLVNTVPSVIWALLDKVLPPSVRTVNLAGESLKTEMVKAIDRMWGVATVHDLYGPTEATTYATYAVRSETGPATIGRALGTTTVYLLDRYGQLVPVGVPGEMAIGGVQVARGYLHRPALTAEKFVPNRFSAAPGAFVYQTGDRARYLANGAIEFLGRIDHQIKLRGYRIELGEIEGVLQEQPQVQETVVLCREDVPGEKQLVAYVTRAQDRLEVTEIRAALQGQLPSYVVPSAFVVLDQMPLTPNGKIDRQALPDPDHTHRRQNLVFIAPRTDLEKLVATVWKEVLHLEQVGTHDNFFEIGGHSLLATQLVSRLNQRAQIDLPLRTVFDCPILAEQASAIEELLLQEMTHLTDSELDQGIDTNLLN